MFGIPVILLYSFALILGIMDRSLGVSEQEPGIPDRADAEAEGGAEASTITPFGPGIASLDRDTST